jgi:hypothetical protein
MEITRKAAARLGFRRRDPGSRGVSANPERLTEFPKQELTVFSWALPYPAGDISLSDLILRKDVFPSRVKYAFIPRGLKATVRG